MNIWHLENKNWTQLILLRTDKCNFRVVQFGDYKPLLGNTHYILIDKKYALIFKGLSKQLTFQEVTIFDYNLKTETDNYIELNIINTIVTSSIKLEDSKGLKIWKYAGNVFVSDDLKTELQKINDDDFVFTIGFSHFG